MAILGLQRLPRSRSHGCGYQVILAASLLLLLGSTVVHAFHDFKKSDVVELTPDTFKQEVLDSTELVMVMFYAPWCGHCKNLVPHWVQAASKLKGIAKLAAIDADQYKQMGQQYGIKGFPTIKMFKGVGSKARRPSDYSGERSAKAIADHAKSILPSLVASIKSDGVDAFFQDASSVPHIILFTDKTTTSPQYKALSTKYHDRISLGEVRVKAGKGGEIQDDIAKRFGIKTLPTLLVFKPGETDPASATRHDSGLDANALISIVSSVVGVADGSSTGSSSSSGKPATEELNTGDLPLDASKEQSKKVFTKPDAHETKAAKITSGSQFMEKCAGRSDGMTCIAMFYDLAARPDLETELDPLLVKFKYEKMAFVILDTSESKDIQHLGKTLKIFSEKEGAIAIRPKKQRYAVLQHEFEFASLQTFLERIVGGDATYQKLPDLSKEPFIKNEVKEEKSCGTDSALGGDTGKCEL